MRPPQSSTTASARNRVVGAAAIAFAVLWVIENALFTVTGAVPYDAPIGDVVAYYANNRDAVAVISGLVALYLPLLLVFVTGLHRLVAQRGAAGADWSHLAMAGGAALSAIFVLFNVTQIGLALSAPGLTDQTAAFELLWQVHAASFGFALPMAGTTCVGMALAAHASGLTPPWQRLLGLVGGSLLLAAGIGCLAIAEGSGLIFVGLLGFVAWLVWLVATGLRLLRTKPGTTQWVVAGISAAAVLVAAALLAPRGSQRSLPR
ncbi:hypothetical protein [uncultured Microbacterium sp.]|uniref:hypothetical protein n=1 Tax=uncultured Microbacterium sp. TaxID=191216 RepID=UPI0025F6B00C|nr:hypothetical protein [uncultured Microbacterium sp.]